jgi:thiamine biosynthesis lipoprotein ApbE
MATNIALPAFKAIAALPSYQGVWMPTVAWIGAIRRETKTESTDQAVSKAIKKVIFDSGGTFTLDATGLELNVFAHGYSVIKAGSKKTSLTHFFFVQSSVYPEPVIVHRDARFWQSRYNRYASKFQKKPETRDRKRRRVDPSPSEVVELTEEQAAANVELVDELRAITEESQRLRAVTDKEHDERPEGPIATPPSNQHDFCVNEEDCEKASDACPNLVVSIKAW